ncbi:MAG: response regulator, partial [Armatimonadetes bacterium]|nr:response regulator [Anaerolineae bacterium]
MAGETILVIDDTEETRDFVVKYVLLPEGYKVLTARDGEEGLRTALSALPDLILLDMNMPRMDGTVVLQKLFEQGADIPVIFMTAHGSEDIAIEVHRLGVRDYIRKPFYPEEMLISIEKNLSEVRLKREKEALTRRVLLANQELHNRVQELNILYGIGKSVTAMMPMAQLMPRIVEAALQLTRAEEGSLLLVEKGKLICRAQKLHTSTRATLTREAITDTIAQHVVQTGQAALVDPNKLTHNLPNLPRNAAYAPMLLKDAVIGVIGVRNVTPAAAAFTQHQAALLSALSDYATIAIENARNLEAAHAQQDAIRGTFERFVSPQVVQQALDTPNGVQPGGSRREVTVLFADIRGYTAWSENATPEQVIETLNHYLGIAAEVILAWEGTLDKFLGDGFMAIFNATSDQPDHVHRGADAALALIKAANEVQAQHGYSLTYSVGVHVGEAIVGYLGTERAMNFTAVGDTVNLAKRLQEYAAPGQVLVEEAVIRRLGGLAQARAL